jgi:hypothetical protein
MFTVSILGAAQNLVTAGSALTSGVNATGKTGYMRKATIEELYAMFFTYAVHIETRSDKDEQTGIDRTFYREHLRKESGLTEEEYSYVLSSAHRFVAVDTDAKRQIVDLTSDGNMYQINSLIENSASSLKEEMDYLHRVLGQDRADELEAYLKNNYEKTTVGSEALDNAVSHPLPQTQDSLVPSNSSQTSGSDINPSRSQLVATPANVTIDGGTTCGTVVDALENSFKICVDSQMSYLGPGNQVELYSYGYVNYLFQNGTMACTTEVGNLYINGASTNISCVPNQYYVPCTMSTPFNSGNGAKYAWDTTETIYYTVSGIGGCYGPNWARMHYPTAPSVTISYPRINSLSVTFFAQGDSGTLIITGQGLISPFQNPPTVTYTGSYFSTFSVLSYAAGTISITYKVSQTANPGTSTVTVNNGFGTASSNITITAPAPTITGISVSGSSASNVLQAGSTTQTVTLTGENFGSTQPTITVASNGASCKESACVTIVSGSVATPALIHSRIIGAKAVASNPSSHLTTRAAVSSNASWNTQQTVSFQVQVAPDASAGSATFQLVANDGQSQAADSPALTSAPIQPTLPLILDGLAEANDNNCSGENIGQGAATAQVIVVGQMVSFTACVSNPDFSGWGVPTFVSASWAPPSNFTTQSAVAGYSLWNLETNTNAKLGNPSVFGNSAVVPVNVSPDCANSISFCDFGPFYFVQPGTYDFTFTYDLNNGTSPQSASVEYIVTGPTDAAPPIGASCPGGIEACALFQVPGSPKIQIFAPGQLNGNPVPIMDADNPLVSGGAALDLLVSATTPGSVPGAFQWVQIITARNQQFKNSNNTGCSNCSVSNQLDNVYPYPGQPGASNEVVDNPSTNLAFTDHTLYEVNDNFQAQMYLMWDPSLNADGSQSPGCAASTVYTGNGLQVASTTSRCSGSIPIPLASFTWGYCGTATNTQNAEPNTWILSCPANGTPDVTPVYIPATGAESYPQWSSVVFNSN